MARTTVDVDTEALEMARRYLQTSGLGETVNAARREAARREILKNFDLRTDIYGTPEEIEAGREMD